MEISLNTTDNTDNTAHAAHNVAEKSNTPSEWVGPLVPIKSEASFQVIFTKNLFSKENPILPTLVGRRKLFFCWCKQIEKIYGRQIRAYLAEVFLADTPSSRFEILVIDAIEDNKNLNAVEQILCQAQAFGLDRKGIFVAVGGGVLADIVGVAATLYRRGVDYIKINTTLVGQIDVGLGIKTGVNFNGAKNFLGSFYPPMASINDTNFIATLPKEEIRCGLAEMLKVAVISDKNLFDRMFTQGKSILENRLRIESDYKEKHTEKYAEKHTEKYAGRYTEKYQDKQKDHQFVYEIAMKMLELLAPNFYEKDLERYVDFGHSLSYLIESSSCFQIRHGDAVAMDMIFSAQVAVLKGLLPQKSFDKLIELYSFLGLPIFDNRYCTLEAVKKAMAHAAKHRGGEMNWVIPVAMGQATFLKKPQEMQEVIIEWALNKLEQTNAELNVRQNIRLNAKLNIKLTETEVAC